MTTPAFSFTPAQPQQQQAQTPSFGGFGTATGAAGASPFAFSASAARPATTPISPFGTGAAPAQAFGASTAAPATGGGFGGGVFGAGGTSTTGGASTASQDNNVPFTGDTSFSALPHHMQQKIWETHKLIMQHRQHAETVSKFSTQDYGLDQHTKKLKLDILRVQNAHSEISLAAGELRKHVERLRGYIHKLQAAESGVAQFSMPTPRGSLELWQQQQDSHGEILREIVGQFESRLLEYDTHVQELYRKIVPSRAAGEGGRLDATSRQITPDQLAALVRLQNDALFKVAAQVASVHEMVERVRSEWNSRTGQDPFEDLDRIAAEEEERKRKASRLVVPSSSQELAQQHIFQLGNGPSGAAPLGLPASTTAGRGGFGASPAAAFGGSSFGGGTSATASMSPFNAFPPAGDQTRVGRSASGSMTGARKSGRRV